MLRDALATTISSFPEQVQADRAELLELLQRRGILHRSPTQPILSRDGTSARWMLDSLAVTLTPRGSELAGRCLLELLKRFDGRQLATYGLTAVPILQSCIAESQGKYHGLLLRKERKLHGSLKLIEGPLDPNEPVILIDDSVSSGTCMTEACALVEQVGLRVEGAIFIVRFGWHGGYALMQERGYHVEALYDIWDDFIYHMEDEEQPLSNPSKWFPAFEWSSSQAPNGLHPAQLARLTITEYLSSGQLLRAPEVLDNNYDSSGGAWISIRSRENVHLRHARDGFWHFPGEGSGSASADVVLASLRTAVELPTGNEGLKLLETSDIAVTFFSALERCSVGQLDNDRYGIVVRSTERPSWMGGALPRMPGIANEWEQFQHARRKNGRLISFEPYEIFRHEVCKTVGPGITWQPSGVPAGEEISWHQDRNIGGRIVERVRDLVLGQWFNCIETTSPLADDLIPAALESIYVTIYVNGQLRGCMGSVVRALDDDLRRLAGAAAEDDRFAASTPNDPLSVAVSVSLLFNPLELGEATAEDIAPYFQIGKQALMAYRGDQVGLLLPFVAATHNLDRSSFAQAVVDKAGLTEPSNFWCRFDCVTWFADAGQTAQLVGGFPYLAPAHSTIGELLVQHASLHTHYLIQHQREDGNFYSTYEPFQNRLYEGNNLPRLGHGAWVMARSQKVLSSSELKVATEKAIGFLANAATKTEGALWLQDAESPSVSEVSFLLLALCHLRESSPHYPLCSDLAATLWSAIELPHGRIMTHKQPAEALDVFQDYLPGQVLLALGTAAEEGSSAVDERKLYQSFSYYRHRFRYQRHFGQVSWLMQAFAQWWRVKREPLFASLVFEIGDWILGYQQEKTGGFINDHQPETPGFTTALYLEGIGAALNLAAAVNDRDRYEKYFRSVSRGFEFLDRLIIQPRDASLLPNPELCFGGLRESLNYSQIRIDFVQHSLSAILESGVSLRLCPSAGDLVLDHK
jgi:orotate phosphoribosyltransferase/AMMECR1 domain-containing protein